MRIELEKINKSFGDHHVLKDLSFTVESGTAFGLLGRNGSGKTTTIRIIMDIFPADSGAVAINGESVRKYLGRIGYLPEERGLYPKRIILEQMVYLGELRGMKAADAKRRAVELLERLDAADYLKRRLDTLSKGNQQKIQLAIALITDPDILILDEPFSGLDPVNAGVLKNLVSEMVAAGKLVIFSSHQMASVEEFCDDICIIDHGEIVLTGNLKKIKRTYPRNRILIIPEDDDVQGFINRLKASGDIKNLASDIDYVKRGCAITLRDEAAKPRLYETISGMGLGIDSFQVMEPSLEDIFIEKCGDAPDEEKPEPPAPTMAGSLFSGMMKRRWGR